MLASYDEYLCSAESTLNTGARPLKLGSRGSMWLNPRLPLAHHLCVKMNHGLLITSYITPTATPALSLVDAVLPLVQIKA
jgi:hypothetical protein